MPKIIRDETQRRTPYSVSLTREVVDGAKTLTATTNLSDALCRVVTDAIARTGALVEYRLDGDGVVVRAIASGARVVAEWSEAFRGAYPELASLLHRSVARTKRADLPEIATQLRDAGYRVQVVDVPDADYYAIWIAPPVAPATVDVLGAIAREDARGLQQYLSAICKRLDEVTRV